MNTPALKGPPVEVEKSTIATVDGLEQRVEKILEARKLTLKWLYDRIGMSKTGYRQMWQANSIKVTVLLDIARALQLDVRDLLYAEAPEKLPLLAKEPSAPYQARPRYLEDRVADLERELHDLKQHLKKR